MEMIRLSGTETIATGTQEDTQPQWLSDDLEPDADRVVVCNIRSPRKAAR